MSADTNYKSDIILGAAEKLYPKEIVFYVGDDCAYAPVKSCPEFPELIVNFITVLNSLRANNCLSLINIYDNSYSGISFELVISTTAMFTWYKSARFYVNYGALYDRKQPLNYYNTYSRRRSIQPKRKGTKVISNLSITYLNSHARYVRNLEHAEKYKDRPIVLFEDLVYGENINGNDDN